MLADQTIPIDFNGSIDTKTDAKRVVPGKWLLAQNAVYTSISDWQKRNGYTSLTTAILGGGNLTAPRMIRTFNGELTCVDQNIFYGYSFLLNCWVSKGNYTSVDLSESFVYQQLSVQGYCDCAVLNNIALYVWDVNYTTVQTMASVVDLSSNSVLFVPQNVSSTLTGTGIETSTPRAVALGSTALAILYQQTTTGALVMRILTTTSGGVSFGPELTIASSAWTSGFGQLYYDVQSTSTGAVVVLKKLGSPDTIKTLTINTSGTVTHTATVTLTGNSNNDAVAVCVDSSTGNIWSYWFDSSNTISTFSVNFAVYDSSLNVVRAATPLSTGLTVVANNTNLSVQPVSSVQQKVFFSRLFEDTDTSQTIDRTFTVTALSSGSIGSTSLFLPGVYPFSRCFQYNGKSYMVYVYRGPTHSSSTSQFFQPTYFVVDLNTGAVVSRFAASKANSFATNNASSYCSNVPLISGSRFLYNCGIEFQFYQAGAFQKAISGAASIQFDFNSVRAYRGVIAEQALVLNGSLVSMYDGQTCAELGFHLAPEISTATATALGPAQPGLGDGLYGYITVLQWTDAQGNTHQSTTSNQMNVTTTGGGNLSSVTLLISMGFLSGKSNISVALYRTKANGSTFFLLGTPTTQRLNSPNSFFFTYVDTTNDVEISSNNQLYTNGGVLPNSPPPASMILLPRNTRLWMVDAESTSKAWYSKSFLPGVGISPSGFLTVQCDPILGNITALATMDDKMVFLKDQGIFWCTGDGANDTGIGSSLSTLQPLPSDVGCDNLPSVIVIPKGVIFHTTNGLYLLDRSLGLHYADQYFSGAAVEAFNSQVIYDARLIPGVSQVRFLVSSGTTLVYDYIFDKWTTFTNHLGYSSDIWQGTYVYARTDGKIFQENKTTFLDDTTPYAVRGQTGWLSFAGIQGFERVRHMLMLGDFISPSNSAYGMQISFAYDFVPTFTSPVACQFGVGSGPLQERFFLPQQKCDCVSLLIEEVPTGASGEYIDFTNMSFNVGIKKGLNKVSAGKSVG